MLNTNLEPEVEQDIQHYLDNSRRDFAKLVDYRQQIDGKKSNFKETFQVYTQLIEQLFSISEHLIHVDMNSQLGHDISAIGAALLFKEYMGQIRALGMNELAIKNNGLYGNLAINLLIGKQVNSLRVFRYSANNEQKALCAEYCDAVKYQQLLAQSFTDVMQVQSIEQRSEYWFNFMSAKINNFKRITDELSQSFNAKVQQESQRLKQVYYVILASLSLFLLCASLFLLMLNYSIISPVRRITHALNSMVKGQLNIRLADNDAKDEIGAMQAAYEKLRRKLLQVDVFQVVVNHQKNEIEYRKSQQAHFENLAFTDALTGTVNRHHFNLILADEITKADSQQSQLSILLLDIDHFKQVNDRFGHGVGDEMLVMFSRACKDMVRNSDVVARIGGEEFVIILPNTNSENAFKFADRLREKIQQLELVVDEQDIKLTVSIGVSQWHNELFSSAQEFVADADKLLYQAKKQGRNKVVIAKV